MHQRSSVWYGEFKPSIVCIAPHRFSIIDAFLEDCIFSVGEYDDFEIVEFQCFQVEEFPESVGIEKISQFNRLHSDKKMNELLNWLKIDNPTYLSIKSKSEVAWSLIYFDNQFWFEIDDKDLQRVERACKLIFQSMKLPAEIIYNFVISHQQQELEVANFVGLRDCIVQQQLSEIEFLNDSLKINTYGFRHIPMDSLTLSPDEYLIPMEFNQTGEGCMRLLLHPVNQIHGDTMLVFLNHNKHLTSPSVEQLSLTVPNSLELKEDWILELMEKHNCEDDLVFVQLSEPVNMKIMNMVLPFQYEQFDSQRRIDVALELIQRALNMCASCNQIRMHLVDPILDLMLDEGDFSLKLMQLVQKHTEANRYQRVFWHCKNLESFRHYFALRKSIIMDLSNYS